MKLVNPIGRVPTNKEDFKAHLEPRACVCNENVALWEHVRGPLFGVGCSHCGCSCVSQANFEANRNWARDTPR